MHTIKRTLFFFFLLSYLGLSSQEIPPISIFNPHDYGAEDQNWSISQASNNFIYVANNAGLLEYNGASWNLYKSPNETILRVVRCIDERIYTSGYMDFGYWVKDDYGNLVYISLSNEKNLKLKNGEEFWGIIDIEDYILFQSFETIYIFDQRNETFNTIHSDNRINKVFKVDDIIYYQKRSEGIFKIENGEEVLVISQLEIGSFEVVNVFKQSGNLLLHTRDNGFFIYNDNKLNKWITEVDDKLNAVSVYSSQRLSDGSIAIGTISDGLLHIDENGNELLSINQSSGLSNNTILSLEEDNFGNLWLGLDNGINVLNLESPYRVYKDKLGVLGTVYTSAIYDDLLYLGTNQGLFYKSIGNNESFNFVEGTEGQCWNLRVINDELFCGHDQGSFLIKDGKSSKISDEIGTWDIKKIPGHPEFLLCGKYKGLSVLERRNNNWQLRNEIDGFDISTRYFEFISSNEILISHEYKGVYKVVLDNDYSSVLKYDLIDIDNGAKSSISKFNNEIVYLYKEGIFRFDAGKGQFVKDTVVSKKFEAQNYHSGKLIYDEKGNALWGFSKNEIVYLQPGKLSNQPVVNTIPLFNDARNSKSGYENILNIKDKEYLIGTSEGYIIVDLNKLSTNNNVIDLNSVSYKMDDKSKTYLELNKSPSLHFKNNTLLFKYSVTNFNKLSSTTYKYRLKGYYDEWSDWSVNSEVYFENLPHGEYSFEAKAKTDGLESQNTISYNFTIEKPWYLKSLAIASYIIIALAILLSVHLVNRKHYKKQKQKLLTKKEKELELEQLVNQRQLIEFKNKNLELDIENKNRELGMATMNLVKRNELLNEIKERLSKKRSIKEEAKDVIKLINTSLNNTSDWKLFEEAFNNVDKDFMKRVKTLHPSITPNDLRLCAYLRLNLSSKEIAPLLNISHKSVEVKRYRLRKKMGLNHDTSLSNYIIEL